ncbi:uncharacterized protein LOC128207869 [Mya arenaria]|uniref:uncharacterized protein LOC128207869 n=1 Tax=Mya arenaria TaxID=6604 RepID=UPI0022DF640F|nr:uncharacterized protein LOC128207869 [Mya arenaria]
MQYVPDINLECHEVINDWDDFESGNCSIYSPAVTDKLPTIYEENSTKVCEIFPPPNSPTAGCFEVFSNHTHYVESLLQMWKESDIASTSQDSTGSFGSDPLCLPAQSSSQTASDVDDAIPWSENESSADGSLSPVSITGSRSNLEDLLSRDGISFQGTGMHFQPVSHSSSRSASPFEIEAISQSVLGLSFDNANSILRMERSPSPIISRSSSPRFLRSPSPFQVLNTSNRDILMDTATENMLMYEERGIRRLYSPVLNHDHQVPDVDMDFQENVSLTEEFPSFSTYVRRRQLNSCGDQIVPEFIEE